MDKLTFAAELLKAVAWPISAVVVVVLLRKSLCQLIPNLREFKGFGAEMKFVEATIVRAVESLEPAVTWSNLTTDELPPLVRLLLKTLAPPERTVIFLYYYEELSYPQIAEVMKIPEEEVRRMHTETLGRLRVKLDVLRSTFPRLQPN